MKVLITNWSLAQRSGTQLYVRDLALALRKFGHTPIVYSTELGVLAEELRDRTIPVIDDLAKISFQPDIIHGQHRHETMTALLRFPDVPAVYVCHDFFSAADVPPKFPRILRYVAVDQACYEKLLYEASVSAERVRLLLSFVDLDRFKRRSHTRKHPQNILLFCNYTDEGEHLSAARAACEREGLTLHTLARNFSGRCETPEDHLHNYDIVLGKGRAALEALATGAAVIPYFRRCIGQMVTANDLPRLLPLNLGARAMTCTPDPQAFADALMTEVRRYDAKDVALACERVREQCGLERIAAEFVSLYEEVIAEHKQSSPPNKGEEALATATYVSELLMSVKREQESFHHSRTYRFFESILGLPIIGKMSVTLAEKLSGKTPGRR